MVILRSNGVPTYNLTSVVDDAAMGITHIIRGDDHLSNTAVQVNLFNALGYGVPVFGHLPMIHGVDGKRLSKRHGAVDINSFLDDGYLVEASTRYPSSRKLFISTAPCLFDNLFPSTPCIIGKCPKTGTP